VPVFPMISTNARAVTLLCPYLADALPLSRRVRAEIGDQAVGKFHIGLNMRMEFWRCAVPEWWYLGPPSYPCL
jgi:hypothetical protein